MEEQHRPVPRWSVTPLHKEHRGAVEQSLLVSNRDRHGDTNARRFCGESLPRVQRLQVAWVDVHQMGHRSTLGRCKCVYPLAGAQVELKELGGRLREH